MNLSVKYPVQVGKVVTLLTTATDLFGWDAPSVSQPKFDTDAVTFMTSKVSRTTGATVVVAASAKETESGELKLEAWVSDQDGVQSSITDIMKLTAWIAGIV